MYSLRNELIRIAYAHPETRKSLLPLLTSPTEGKTAAGDPKKSLPAFRSYIIRWYLAHNLPKPRGDEYVDFNYAGQNEVFSALDGSIKKQQHLSDAIANGHIPVEDFKELVSTVTAFYKSKKQTKAEYPKYLQRIYKRMGEASASAGASIPSDILTWKPSKNDFSSLDGASQKLLLDRIEEILSNKGKFPIDPKDSALVLGFKGDPDDPKTEGYWKHYKSRPRKDWAAVEKMLKNRSMLKDLHDPRRWENLHKVAQFVLSAQRIPDIRKDYLENREISRSRDAAAWIRKNGARVYEQSKNHVIFSISPPGDRSKKDQKAFVDTIRAKIEQDRPQWVKGPTMEKTWGDEVLLKYTF